MNLSHLMFIATLLPFAAANTFNYSEEVALEAVRYSSAAYCGDTERLTNWTCESCNMYPQMKVRQVFQNEDTGGYGFIGVDESQHKVVIAFRGTQFSVFETVVSDLEFWKSDYPESIPDSAVHSGFLKYYMSVRDIIRTQLSALKKSHPSFEVWITGHSLGAAVAQIAAVDLHDIAPNPIVYCFGSPRVGNHAFAEHYHSIIPRSIRVVHSNDIVAQLPPCLLDIMEGFKCSTSPNTVYHTPQEIHYPGGDNKGMICNDYTICDAHDGEGKTASDECRRILIRDSKTCLQRIVWMDCCTQHLFQTTRSTLVSKSTINADL